MDSDKRILPLVALVLSVIVAVWAVFFWDDYYSYGYTFLVLLLLPVMLIGPPLAGAGIWFLWRALARKLRIDAESRRTPQIFPGVPIRNVLPWKPQKLAPITVNLPNFGHYCGFVFNVVMFIFMIVTPRTPTGLKIPMTLRNPGAGLNSPRTETLGVYVAAGSQFYVNGEAVPQERLREKLREELGKRVVWTVYVEADNDATFSRVVYVFSTVKDLGAQAYWITPGMREEWEKPSSP